MIHLLVLIWNRYLNCKIKSRIQLKDFLSAEFDFFSLALFPPLFEPFRCYVFIDSQERQVDKDTDCNNDDL